MKKNSMNKFEVQSMISISAYFLILSLALLQSVFTSGSTFDSDEWTPWSHHTPCSRTCDGGITQQYRRCKSPNGCHGVSIRRKMCNMQACVDGRDFRSEQCSSFNGLRYRGEARNWEAVEDPDDPCGNICRAKGTNIVAKLSSRLKDGTRCASGSLHVCVDGKCEPVGCDLKLGSPKKVDECGICGGDGSACLSAAYRWAVVPIGICSTLCGGGHEEVKVICQNSFTDEIVDSSLCNSAMKPYRTTQNCNIQPCEPEWEIGEWSICSKTCGGGLKIRKVVCAQEKNSSKIQVAEKLCQHLKKPSNQEPCNEELCSHWHVGPWSECEVSCGEGMRTRNVVCRDSNNLPSSKCDGGILPPSISFCEQLPPCPLPAPILTTQINGKEEEIELTTSEEYDNSLMRENNTLVPYSTAQMSTEVQTGTDPKITVTDLHIDLDYLEPLEELQREHTLPLVQPYSIDNSALFEQYSIPSEPTFVADAWGECSEACGEGVRRREVNCKIFLEFTRTVANLPDKECFGPKPPISESCILRPCSHLELSKSSSGGEESLSDSEHAALSDSESSGSTYRKTVGFGLPPGISMQDMTFSWKVDGYTPCSASCLGGVQERRIVCVRDYDQRAATPVLCMDKPRPDIPTTRTCNDHPCPPRWNVTEFGPCSKSCGGGVKTREVSCIHEVTRGNTVTVPNTQCPHPFPRTEMLCNAVDCPPYWDTEEWDKCSKPCDGGVRSRKLICKQIIALGQVVDRSPGEAYCTQTPPPSTRPCNKKPCHKKNLREGVGSNKTIGLNSNSFHSYTMDGWKSKLTLTVRGYATIFNGVSLKLRCPTKSEMDKNRLVWMKDYNYIHIQSNKIEVLPRAGSLKIKNTTFSDSGVYTCLINERPISNLTLMVQPYKKLKQKSVDFENGESFEESNSIGVGGKGPNSRGKSSAHDSTLYADQQPGVSVGPFYNFDSNHPSDSIVTTTLLKPNTKLFSGSSDSSSSSSSNLKPFFHKFITNFLWLLWPFRSELNRGRENDENLVLIDENNFVDCRSSSIIPVFSRISRRRTLRAHFSPSSSQFHDHNNNNNDLRKSSESSSLEKRGRRRRVRHSHNTIPPNNNNYKPTTICANTNKETSSNLNNLYYWSTENWTSCSDATCFTWNTSRRQRVVECKKREVSDVQLEINCNHTAKPEVDEECFNEKCVGIWITEPWSQCKAQCDSVGFKARILKCVWYGSGQPAGNACQLLTRPSVTKPCLGLPCPKNGECVDRNHQCAAIKLFNLCHISQYKSKCCESCSDDLSKLNKFSYSREEDNEVDEW